ncbi:uncharacterized protein LOC109826864 [Asparagus officinalis]|uniref:uncharacterized protein LOC109826864 n=1 Tax=Asparagus officinalis TaxID=4686 RepID=UPI00098E75D3|nr:uncharacterized protein LOC109826864 [Asparagus officinalis]
MVKQFIHQYNLPFIALLETKVVSDKLQSIAKKVVKDWTWISNCHQANNARIWILWNSEILSVQLINSSNQFMTCAIASKDSKLSGIITVVYALNDISGRKSLWHDILAFKQSVTSPWVIGGDFNSIINNGEKIGGAMVTESETEDFQDFISSCQFVHLKTTGCFYTWCNKQDKDTRIWSRLDRVLINEEWVQQYTSSQVEFLPPSCSDHSPALITIVDDTFEGKRPFKFFKMWTNHPDFLSAVKSVWDQDVVGYRMFKFHTKLKKLKVVLKELNKKHFMNISEQVLRAKDQLAEAQKQLNSDLFSPVLIAKERECKKPISNGGSMVTNALIIFMPL